MPALITPSFFIGEINVPNTGKADVLEKLNIFIGKYEPECLLRIMGYPLYKAFLAEDHTIAGRMKDLLYGTEFSVNGNLYFWQGIIHNNLSLIANYIYWFLERSNATQTTGVATVIPKGASAMVTSPDEKMVAAWNFFSSEINGMIFFLRNKKDNAGILVYPEFTSYQAVLTDNLSRKTNIFGF